MRYILFFVLAFVGTFAVDNEQLNNLKISTHTININGKELKYTATAGTLPIKRKSSPLKEGDKSDPSVNIFFVSYVLESDKLENRPITFVFNGGPGSSSVWLHFGAFGPKKILFKDEPNIQDPFKFIENDQSLLEYTDLVFIDPVGTGFSQTASDNSLDEFYSIQGDANLIGDFICKYITVFDRWLSKKFISGESYGTIRAICATEYLQDHLGININGLSLISPIINGSHLFEDSDQMAYAFSLPSYAATARYHKLLSPELMEKSLYEFLDDVRSFALNDYALALIHGDTLNDSQKEEIVRRLSMYTALPRDIIIKNNLKVDAYTFCTNLLPQDAYTDLDNVVGWHDTRFRGYSAGSGVGNDKENPSLTSILSFYSSVANNYFRNELGYVHDDAYVVLSDCVNMKWNWEKDGQRDLKNLDLSKDFKHILAVNPKMKIIVASGFYDLVTTYGAAEYDINHLHLPAKLRSKIVLHGYEAGHMMYLNDCEHKKLTKDLISLYQ